MHDYGPVGAPPISHWTHAARTWRPFRPTFLARIGSLLRDSQQLQWAQLSEYCIQGREKFIQHFHVWYKNTNKPKTLSKNYSCYSRNRVPRLNFSPARVCITPSHITKIIHIHLYMLDYLAQTMCERLTCTIIWRNFFNKWLDGLVVKHESRLLNSLSLNPNVNIHFNLKKKNTAGKNWKSKVWLSLKSDWNPQSWLYIIF